MLLAIAHAAVVAINGFSMWYFQHYVELAPYPHREQILKLPMNGRVIYLTVWGMILQTAYFTIALLNDLIGTSEQSPKKPPLIRTLKDYVFAVAFPVGMWGSTVFWGTYLYDRELVFPVEATKTFPAWLNHTSHTTISIFIYLELLLTKRTYPSSKVNVTLVSLYLSAYIVWLHTIHAWYGDWVYPIFDALNGPGRIVFHAFNLSLMATFAILGHKLDAIVSKKDEDPKKKRK